MVDMGIVHGSKEAAQPLVVGKTTVYVHTNIQKVEGKDERGEDIQDMYSYHEIQYGKDEYIKLQSEKQDQLEEDINTTQLALMELYESMGE